jgi:hypothetical protein
MALGFTKRKMDVKGLHWPEFYSRNRIGSLVEADRYSLGLNKYIYKFIEISLFWISTHETIRFRGTLWQN